ncbi:TLC domain-containing protein At5g14285 [Physcomitrium patens]|uniref:TLC domain-containing protein n=1 Tax=Physcomitrium patens TaxID=3218 RepID=A9SZF9_PHYPA|nr:TLC domain-containing protein At5g14285-like [Physcomitrium patens]XP_024392052.1 TLC domain-containing protein At5g14285-like [Physcomitrium patens]PNR42682.1 hypothetical protein PHYPA_017512 [Physcomitrium patens]|eukprot:XP_024392051.1 TLC domain-containing protein At5g14285-like [Physcomitrella patens]
MSTDFLTNNLELLASVGLFTAVYFYGYFFVFHKLWKGRARYDAASCGISLAHGTVVAALACYGICSQEWVLDAPNTYFQDKIMEYSMAYFIVDLLNYFIAAPDDYLFIGHHIATLTYMISCRYFVRHGAVSVMCLIAAGELTSPVQNIWTLSRMAREDSPTAKKIYTNLSPFFTLFFTIVRGGFGPYLTWTLGKFYLGGHADKVMPRWLAYCWMFKVAFAIFGSMVWVYKLWVGLIKFYSKKGSSSRRKSEGLFQRKDD